MFEIAIETGIVAIAFNKEFYCIRDHDHAVSCNALLFFGSSQPPVITLSEKYQNSFETIFTVCKQEFETQDDVQGEMLRAMLKRLLIISTRLITEWSNVKNLTKPQREVIRKFHILVETHYKQQHQVTAYAEMLYKSPTTISTLF